MAPSQQDTRSIPFGGGRRNTGAGDKQRQYPKNSVITSKYTILNFVPLNLWEQLHKAANVYFLGISIIMMLGNLTTLFVGTVKFLSTFLTLAIMMTMSAVIAAIDDVRRHRSDRQTNSQKAVVVQLGENQKVQIDSVPWEGVRVGDVLVVVRDKELPADLVLLASSGDEGSCYVSTANLDGETNLKIKTAVPAVQRALCDEGGHADKALINQAVDELKKISGTVSAEPPQKSIYSFSGSLQLDPGPGQSEFPLGPEQLLLRGTVLRNTAWCLGLVVYTGKETRMVMNSRKAKPKYANVERVINRSLFVVIGAQCLLALLSDVLFCATKHRWLRLWYVHPDGQETHIMLPDLVGYWLTFFVLYSNLMPISLYFTMEMCNVAQAYFIKSDLKMYDEDQDTPANSRSTNLGHELGQVSYIFSDKTGTLTQNIMELKRVSIGDAIFGQVGGDHGFHGGDDMDRACRSDEALAAARAAFLEVLAVSHTVVPTTDQNGELKYEAESPDESALVEAAAALGWAFQDRSRSSLTVSVADSRRRRPGEGRPEARSYSLLALNAFTSARKRQSVVVQRADGQRVLLVKGADDVMLKRAAQTPPSIQDHLTEFAQEGLRTLVLGRRNISESELDGWVHEYEEAQTKLVGRDTALAEVAEKIEVQLEIVGVTAIEDRLQEKVQDTIVSLKEAGVIFWVLTGDKLETARNIGFSTGVLSDEMDIKQLVASTRQDVEQRLEELEKELGEFPQAAKDKKAEELGRVAGLLVTGQALEIVTAQSSGREASCAERICGEPPKSLAKRFFDVARRCSVVIACRVAPLQKAEMVRLVRDNAPTTPVTLAIGDGANDVPMIQEASIGVGISGREGRQAANSADFSIAQFRFLQRLLLIHGRWNYRRTCKFVLYSFWKNTVLVLLMFYYTLASGFSGISLFEDMVRASYNVILATPIVATGIFDKDVEEKEVLDFPKFYDIGRLGEDLNAAKLVEMLLSAFVHSNIILWVMVLAYDGLVLADLGDYYSFGTTTFTVLVVAMNYRACILTRTWTVGNGLAHLISWILYALFLGIYCMLEPVTEIFNPWMYMLPVKIFSNPLTYICLAVVPLLAIVVDVVKVYVMFSLAPEPLDRLKRLKKERERLREEGGGSSACLEDGSRGAARSGSSSGSTPWCRCRDPLDGEEDGGAVEEAEERGEATRRRTRRSTDGEEEGDAMAQEPGPSGLLARASSYDFAHPEGPPRDHRSLGVRHPTAGDTSLVERAISASAASSSPGSRRGAGGLLAGASTSDDSSQSEESGGEDFTEVTGVLEKSNRPADSRFAQQNLKFLQVEITCKFVFGAALISGLLLVSLGCLLTHLTSMGGEIFIHYSGDISHFWMLQNWTSPIFEKPCRETEADGPTGKSCKMTIELPVTLLPPVQVYYSIHPFFQNYPDYIQSGLQVWPELTGNFLSEGQRREYCPPTSRVTPDGQQIYPCGVAATSLFNDTLEILGVERATGERFIPEMYIDVAWESDVARFGNPSIYPETPSSASDAAEKYSWLFDRYPTQLNRSLGVKDPRFVDWMRPQALTITAKRFSATQERFDKGDSITFRINSTFPVASINAAKTFIITSGGALRGGDGNFGWACVISGGVCLFLAGLVFVIHRVSGDTAGYCCDGREARVVQVSEAESSEGSDSA